MASPIRQKAFAETPSPPSPQSVERVAEPENLLGSRRAGRGRSTGVLFRVRHSHPSHPALSCTNGFDSFSNTCRITPSSSDCVLLIHSDQKSGPSRRRQRNDSQSIEALEGWFAKTKFVTNCQIALRIGVPRVGKRIAKMQLLSRAWLFRFTANKKPSSTRISQKSRTAKASKKC